MYWKLALENNIQVVVLGSSESEWILSMEQILEKDYSSFVGSPPFCGSWDTWRICEDEISMEKSGLKKYLQAEFKSIQCWVILTKEGISYLETSQFAIWTPFICISYLF